MKKCVKRPRSPEATEVTQCILYSTCINSVYFFCYCDFSCSLGRSLPTLPTRMQMTFFSSARRPPNFKSPQPSRSSCRRLFSHLQGAVHPPEPLPTPLNELQMTFFSSARRRPPSGTSSHPPKGAAIDFFLICKTPSHSFAKFIQVRNGQIYSHSVF